MHYWHVEDVGLTLELATFQNSNGVKFYVDEENLKGPTRVHLAFTEGRLTPTKSPSDAAIM